MRAAEAARPSVKLRVRSAHLVDLFSHAALPGGVDGRGDALRFRIGMEANVGPSSMEIRRVIVHNSYDQYASGS